MILNRFTTMNLIYKLLLVTQRAKLRMKKSVPCLVIIFCLRIVMIKANKYNEVLHNEKTFIELKIVAHVKKF